MKNPLPKNVSSTNNHYLEVKQNNSTLFILEEFSRYLCSTKVTNIFIDRTTILTNNSHSNDEIIILN